MDPLLYNAMIGAQKNMGRQNIISTNLANANTPGFKADMYQAQTMMMNAEEKSTTMAVEAPNAIDLAPGTVITTGRDLDVAIEGEGWFAVRDANGKEAYTRAGNFKIDANGVLSTSSGLPVLGDGGPISIPPAQHIEIGTDGTISIVPLDGAPGELAVIDRLKLANTGTNELIKGLDGLIRQSNGAVAPSDASISIVTGALESSNINTINEMVNMIATGREFDAQMNFIHTVDENGDRLARLLHDE